MLPPVVASFQEPGQDPGRCLAYIEKLVDYLLCEPLTVGRIFGSPELDALCQQIGRRNLGALGLETPPESTPGVAVYIASKLQSSGGHTTALLDLIRLSPKCHSIILITGVCGRTDLASIQRRLSVVPDIELVCVPAGGHVQKLSWIQAYLHKIAPSSVWLFNHHQDSVAIAAVQPDRGYQLNFYHHADDRLCLGVCLGHGKHFDISPAQFHKCRDEVGLQDNRYLPLTATDLQGSYTGDKLATTPMVTCTAAGFNKVEVSYFAQYVDVIPRVLKATGGRHIHIGRLTRLARWRLRQNMTRIGVPLDALVYIPHVHSVWRALHEHRVDLYINSFPYGGSKTMVEVMGAGVPIIVHRNIADRLIGGLDMAYDGAYSWRNPEELYQQLITCSREFLTEQSVLARAWYEKYHSESAISVILSTPDSLGEVPDLKPGFKVDVLMKAWQLAHEATFFSVAKKRLWRVYRSIKSNWGRRC
ncbi:hypothetical protein [Azonexus fungiphilus]|uniref:hypothetical protein n=1 Tax=Azonexus fungiphilus TaxID=146940 RepID=UPI00156BBFC7|nr:hypothetical protein [Azonexus fungiphilus]NHC08159.1 hypothetical protein [Azonexus fungiphilus]